MTPKDKEFIEQCKVVIKGLNDMTIKHPETAELFNKTTTMLEGKIKAIEEKEAPNGN
jgi:hypothetical protein